MQSEPGKSLRAVFGLIVLIIQVLCVFQQPAEKVAREFFANKDLIPCDSY